MRLLITLNCLLVTLITGAAEASTTNAYDILNNVYAQFALPANKQVKAAFDTCYSFSIPITNNASRAELEKWMFSIQGPFNQVSAAIKIGYFKFPKFDVHNPPNSQLSGFRQIARCESARARLSMEEKDYQTAATALLETFQMGQLITHGEGPLIHYLTGLSVQGIGLQGFMVMSTNSEVPTATLQLLFEKMPEAPNQDTDLTEAFKCERDSSFGQSLDDIQKFTSSPPNGFPTTIGINVFDRGATIAMLNNAWERMTANTTNSWLGRDQRIEADLRRITGCKTDNTEGFFWEYTMCFGDTNQQTKCWNKVVEKAKKMPNILGREYVSLMNLGNAPLEKSVRCRTEKNIVRTMLAITLYKRQMSKLPESLEDLVSSGILTHIPLDLFSGKPFLYSKEKRIVWSVGPDGRNNKGHKDKDIARSFLAN